MADEVQLILKPVLVAFGVLFTLHKTYRYGRTILCEDCQADLSTKSVELKQCREQNQQLLIENAVLKAGERRLAERRQEDRRQPPRVAQGEDSSDA